MNKKKILLITVACAILLTLADAWVAGHSKSKPDRPLRMWVAGFSPDGKTIITAGGTQSGREPPDSCEVLVWNAKTGKRKELLRQAATIRSMAWSHDGKFVVLGDWGGTTKLINPATGKILGFLTPHGDVVNSVAVSADNKLIASACVDGTLTLCDVTGKELNTFTMGNDRFMSVAMAPDGGSLAAGAASGKAFVFKLSGHEEPIALAAYPGTQSKREHRVETVAYSPDGRSVVTGCQATLRLWDPASGRLVRELQGNTGEVNCAAFSPDGETLATMDSHGTLALWNPTTGEQITSTTAHPCTSFSISYTADGRRLATVGREDFTLNIWDARTLARVATFHRAGK